MNPRQFDHWRKAARTSERSHKRLAFLRSRLRFAGLRSPEQTRADFPCADADMRHHGALLRCAYRVASNLRDGVQ